jgi:hypothetical protein
MMEQEMPVMQHLVVVGAVRLFVKQNVNLIV